MKKFCNDCAMPRDVIRRDGTMQSRCKSCINKYSKEFYERTKRVVFEHYGNVCACCGEDMYLFLTIDHINNDGYRETYQSGKRVTGKTLYASIVKRNYPSEYQLLCMNCNFGKRMNQGTCPHELV